MKIGEYFTDGSGNPYLLKDIKYDKRNIMEIITPSFVVLLDVRRNTEINYISYSSIISNIEHRIWYLCDKDGNHI